MVVLCNMAVFDTHHTFFETLVTFSSVIFPKGDQPWVFFGRWNSSTLATSCEELTHWKRLWCWEGLGAGGEGDDRGWDGSMASPTWWTWVWVNSGSWWWTGRPGMLRFMGSQRVGYDWATELNWIFPELFSLPWISDEAPNGDTDRMFCCCCCCCFALY